jgi:hypothetical protein
MMDIRMLHWDLKIDTILKFISRLPTSKYVRSLERPDPTFQEMGQHDSTGKYKMSVYLLHHQLDS